MTTFDKLPNWVQQEVKETLNYFVGCDVSFYNGEWHIVAGGGIFGEYPKDYKFYGEYVKRRSDNQIVLNTASQPVQKI